MIKLRDLEYLDAIDRYKHFGKAAEACHVSQPTLSGQIIKLEEQLGLTLFERHRRNILLTPAGEQLLTKARRVLNAADDFELTAKTLCDPLAGELHLGLIPTLAPYLLPHVMSELVSSLPNIEFYLHEEQTSKLLDSLNAGKLDALILPWLEGMEKFEAYDLFDEPFVLAVPPGHALAEKKRAKLSDLHGYKVLTLEDGHCLRDQALGYCFSAGAEEDKHFQATSLETLRYMVAAGVGITLLPKLAVLNHENLQDVKYIPFQKPVPSRRNVILIRPNYTRMECIREMVSIIRRKFRKELNI